MSVNTNTNVQGKPDDHPINPDHPTETFADLPFTANYMMALLNSIQQTTDNIYKQQAADANSLKMLQQYMQAIQKTQSDNINEYIKANSNNYTNEVAAQVSQMQAQMSAEVEKANSAVGSMKSTLGNDITSASQILNFFDSLTTITSFTSSLLR